jgi:hypothetical protein
VFSRLNRAAAAAAPEKGVFYILYIKGVKRKSKAEKRFLKKIHKKEGFLTAALEALITHIGRNCFTYAAGTVILYIETSAAPVLRGKAV